MNRKLFSAACIVFAFFIGAGQSTNAQIPNQLAEDFVAGAVPSPEDVAKFEKDAAAKPEDLRLTRKLGKAYFFQFFAEGDGQQRLLLTLGQA